MSKSIEGAEFSGKIILPKSLDEDIKRRLNYDVVFTTCEETHYPDLERLRRNDSFPSVEVIYNLYGREENNILICSGFYFRYYYFWIIQDCFEISPNEIVWNYPYPLLNNPERNTFQDADYLGSLHNHDNPVSGSQKISRSVRSVGLSRYRHTGDWRAFDESVKIHGRDGRKVCSVIYYSHPSCDFYKGLYRTVSSPARYLDVEIK